ncbi:MAG: DUF2156 domain-containing protein [Oscillospiraceae bacterium]|nr:DUF2156 domain-containing protein [Oscillospiraceae bacterium]
MCDFQPIGLQHKPLFDACLAWENTLSSTDSFGNVFLWDILCRRNVARLGDRLGVEYMCPRGTFYAYPIGRGDLSGAVEALRRRARAQGVNLRLHGVSASQRRELESALPGRFRFTEDRDSFDYLYSVEAMATLAGKKLHGKRNFCNRFESAYRWRFEDLSPAHFDACRALLRYWDGEKDGGNEEENQAIERVFRYWDHLGMSGGVLYAEDEPVAFTIGEPLSPRVIDAHFEKARDDVPGAYPMVAREYARRLRERCPDLVYINREEDMGLPNLRRAKEEWYPALLLEKYTAEWEAAE